MSGGHWDYSQSQVQNCLDAVAEDEDVRRRFPQLATLFQSMGEILFEAIHDLDYDLSSDSHIKNDEQFERRAIGRILEAAMTVAPDTWFPKGKWATIQAVQWRKEEDR